MATVFRSLNNHKALIFLCALLSLGLCSPAEAQNAPANPREFEMQEGDTTYVMKQYWFVMLVRGDRATSFSKEELEKLQEGHMANINRCAEMGKLLVAGPFGDDSEWRGIFVFDADTQAEVEELLKGDPAIEAGRLKAVIHPWWAAKGTCLK